MVRYQAEKADAEAVDLEPAEAAQMWVHARVLYGQIHDDADALRCANKAFEAFPNDFNVRFYLATCLLSQKKFDEAEQHLTWCRNRSPQDANVETLLRETLKGRMETQNRAAKESEPLR